MESGFRVETALRKKQWGSDGKEIQLVAFIGNDGSFGASFLLMAFRANQLWLPIGTSSLFQKIFNHPYLKGKQERISTRFELLQDLWFISAICC